MTRLDKIMATRRKRYGPRSVPWGDGVGSTEHGECMRAEILHQLLDGPLTSIELAERLRITQRAVLKHMAILRREKRVQRTQRAYTDRALFWRTHG